MPNNDNKMRYERKFFISDLTKYEIESIIKLHPFVFSEIYYERTINNFYLDSFNMKDYFDNVTGAGDRRKTRIRWYGGILGKIEKSSLELKIKKGSLCNKLFFPLNSFSLEYGFSISVIRDLFRASEIPDALRLELECRDISLFNRYRRKYYISKDEKYRITLDTDLEFREVSCFNNSFVNQSIDRISNILEIKYDERHESGVDKVTDYFPFRMTKSSKYIMGIERLNLMKTYSHV